MSLGLGRLGLSLSQTNGGTMPIGIRRNGDGTITLTGIVGDLVYELNNSTTHVEVSYPGSTYNIAGSVYTDTCQAWHAGASLAAMAAPVSGVASLDALSFEEDSGDQLVDFGQYFTGVGITYTVSPDDSIASINASTGVVTYVDDDALAETTFTVTGTNLAGNDTITQDVTVTAVADVTAPTISSTSPTDNATDIAITVNPTVTFDEDVAFGTGLITLYDVTGAAAVETFDVEVDTGGGAGTVSISGAVLTIEPTASLDNSNEYAIQIAATAIDDLAGNSFAGVTDTTTISFTTAAAAEYTFYTNEGGTSFTYDETTLTVVGGTYDGATLEVTPAELATGDAFQVVAPADATSALPNAVVTPGLYVSLEEIEYTIRWYADDAEIVGETGTTYTLLSPDHDTATVEYRETVSTMSAGSTVYTVTVQDGYQEVALNFDGSTYYRTYHSQMTAYLGGTNIQDLLLFLSYDIGAGLDAGDVFYASNVRLYSNAGSNSLTFGNATHAFGADTGRVHILATITGNNLRAVKMTPGGSVSDSGNKAITQGAFMATTGPSHIGATSAADCWGGKIYNVSMWDLRAYGGTFPDVTDSGVQDLFWNADGVMRPPAMAQAVYGDGDGGANERMIIGLYGDASLSNNGQDYINLGGGLGQQFGAFNALANNEIVGNTITATIP